MTEADVSAVPPAIPDVPTAPEMPRLSKEPWLAASLSFSVSGAGQFYSGRIFAGILFLAGAVAADAVAFWGFFGTSGGLVQVTVGLVAAVAIWVTSLVHAHHLARVVNSPEAEQTRRAAKDPWLAVFLSLIFAGVGHLYLKRIVTGVLLILGTVALHVFARPLRFGGWVALVAAGYTALACVLAWRAAPEERRAGWGPLAFVAALTLLSALAYVVPLVSTGLQTFVVRSGGMSPTVRAGDAVFAVRTHLSELRRGDVIVFRRPTAPDPGGEVRVYVSRVVGFPGEEVECRGDGVFVNGGRLTDGIFARLRYSSLSMQLLAKPGRPYGIPPDSVFVLGDNSEASFDSRFYGGVPGANVIGRVTKRWFPLNRSGPVE